VLSAICMPVTGTCRMKGVTEVMRMGSSQAFAGPHRRAPGWRRVAVPAAPRQ
jgi:hypothetical protein